MKAQEKFVGRTVHEGQLAALCELAGVGADACGLEQSADHCRAPDWPRLVPRHDLADHASRFCLVGADDLLRLRQALRSLVDYMRLLGRCLVT